MRYVEMAGKTVEDAVRLGLKELGCDSSEVKIDVLDMGSPGLFGMFGHLAKVRLTVKANEDEFKFDMPSMSLNADKPAAKAAPKAAKPAPEPVKIAPKPAPEPAKPPVAKPAPESAKQSVAKPVPESAKQSVAKPVPEPAKQPETSVAAPIPAPTDESIAPTPVKSETSAARSAIKRSPRPAPQRQAVPRPAARPAPRIAAKPQAPLEVVPSDPATLSDTGRQAYEFLKNVTDKMGVPVNIAVSETDEQLSAQMGGDTLGILIGRRGETLDALQYLTSLQVNKGREKYLRVSLDTENYRAKREEALTSLAMRMAARVRKTGHKMALEPMNPYERRVLHSALQGNPYVSTHSEGEDPYRRVIITLKSEDAAADGE